MIIGGALRQIKKKKNMGYATKFISALEQQSQH